MCIKNTHFKCLESSYRDSRVEVTHLFLEWISRIVCISTYSILCDFGADTSFYAYIGI